MALRRSARGVCIIGHGRANAIKNADYVVAEFWQGKVNQRIEQELVVAT